MAAISVGAAGNRGPAASTARSCDTRVEVAARSHTVADGTTVTARPRHAGSADHGRPPSLPVGASTSDRSSSRRRNGSSSRVWSSLGRVLGARAHGRPVDVVGQRHEPVQREPQQPQLAQRAVQRAEPVQRRPAARHHHGQQRALVVDVLHQRRRAQRPCQLAHLRRLEHRATAAGLPGQLADPLLAAHLPLPQRRRGPAGSGRRLQVRRHRPQLRQRVGQPGVLRRPGGCHPQRAGPPRLRPAQHPSAPGRLRPPCAGLPTPAPRPAPRSTPAAPSRPTTPGTRPAAPARAATRSARHARCRAGRAATPRRTSPAPGAPPVRRAWPRPPWSAPPPRAGGRRGRGRPAPRRPAPPGRAIRQPSASSRDATLVSAVTSALVRRPVR